jgi:uncharacterized protein (TIGR03435 family)
MPMSRRVRVAVVLGVALSCRLAAQTPNPTNPASPPSALAFEVASVKPSDPKPATVLGGMPRILPVGGRLTVANLPLRLLIRLAFEVQDFQVVGGPSDLLAQKFDITAKAEDGAGQSLRDLLAMTRTLLAERFALRTHLENREASTYALVVARPDGRLGPNLRPSTADCASRQGETQERLAALANEGPAALMKAMAAGPIPCTVMPALSGGGAAGAAAGGLSGLAGGIALRGDGQTMLSLVQLLTQATGRQVVDRTSLAGLYDWNLRFDPEVMLRMAGQLGMNVPAASSLPPSDSPALLTAIQEQLGLKLDSQKGPVEHLVIDHVEAPSPD